VTVLTATGFPLRTRIKIRQILLLAHLDNERSLLRAANALGISQPAASKLLSELEEGLGVSLFTRHARGVEANAFGEILLRHAHSVLSEIHQAQQEIAALKRGEKYRVAIGSVLTPSVSLIPHMYNFLRQRHPEMLVHLEVDTSRLLIDKLFKGQLDIVVGRTIDLDRVHDLSVETLAEESHCLICSINHPLTEMSRLEIKDLVDFSWVMPFEESLLRERLNAMFATRGIRIPRRIIEATSIPLIVSLIQNSEALVALPSEVVKPYTDAGMLKILPVNLGISLDAYSILTRRNHTLSDDASNALIALRESYRLATS